MWDYKTKSSNKNLEKFQNIVGDKSNRFRKAGPSNGHIITKIYKLTEHVKTLTHKASNVTDFVVSTYT